ncbi:MAG: hypothetical protein IKP89_00355 [Bacteroidales bacterium]|nr:hypothetical protein [Bacteroidales bacterium]
MKKTLFYLFILASLGISQAQTISKSTAEQYRQLATFNGQRFQTCKEQLTRWGFTYNQSGVIDMLSMKMHPFFRAEGEDTVGAMLSVIDEVVYSLSGIVSSREPAHIFPLIAQASAIQQQLATEKGLTKYVCSVKGEVSNKFPKSHDELVSVLAEATAESVGMVYETWKSTDGKQTVSLIYNNKLYGKKKPKARDRAELNLGIGTVPERE